METVIKPEHAGMSEYEHFTLEGNSLFILSP